MLLCLQGGATTKYKATHHTPESVRRASVPRRGTAALNVAQDEGPSEDQLVTHLSQCGTSLSWPPQHLQHYGITAVGPG